MTANDATAGKLRLADVTNAIELIGNMGYNADTIFISPAHYKSLLDIADFTAVYVASTPRDSGGNLGQFQDTPLRMVLLDNCMVVMFTLVLGYLVHALVSLILVSNKWLTLKDDL